MAGVMGDTPRLWGLVAAHLLKRALRKLRMGPVFRWRFSGRTPERVLIAPPDLRLADRQIAQEIYSGSFPLAGNMVETGGRSPFQIAPPSIAWSRELHDFSWLRHMRRAGSELAAANSRSLVADWISLHGSRIRGIAWDPAVTARRIIAWLQHSTIVLQGAEFPFYRAYLKSLAAQIRYLRAVTANMEDGENRLRARIALAYAALSLPLSNTHLRTATKQLARELDRQILADGGHMSRNPMAVLELLADLLPLRQTYTNQAEPPPPELVGAIERMLPALRFFRHQNGNLALFNGVGATLPDRVFAILQHDKTGGSPLLHAPYSGYERLNIGNTTVIADTGTSPPVAVSENAHAGCLSFELSSGRHLYVVNAGVDTLGPAEYRILSRATAAHSTATICDTSSCRFSISPWMREVLGTPLVAGPRQVTLKRTDDGEVQGFSARHDGYFSRFGLFHERQLVLSASGSVLDGLDRFSGLNGTPPIDNGQDLVTIRFHLHPDIHIILNGEGHYMLMADQDDSWVFTSGGVAPVIEDSIYFAGMGGPKKNKQIVLTFKASEFPELPWRFTRTGLGVWS